MIRIRFAIVTGWFLFTIAVLQASADAQAAPSLQAFFQGLVQHYDPSSLPQLDDVLKVTDQIAGARPEDITKALPAIFAALAHHDDTVKKHAALTLFSISQRGNSAELLRKYVGSISSLFDLSDPGLQATPTLIFLNLKPTPPEVVPLLLNFLKRTDRDPHSQGSAIFTLVRCAPENPDVIAAIQEFLSRPLDTSTRIGVLNALGYPDTRDARVVSVVIASLDDPDQGVRSTAIQALMRMNQDALRQAEPTLQRLATDQKQPANVVADARAALQKLHPNK